jgi:hypothetical protein
MDERIKRVWAASEAKALGRGGVTVVAQAAGLSRQTIQAGKRVPRVSESPIGDQPNHQDSCSFDGVDFSWDLS